MIVRLYVDAMKKEQVSRHNTTIIWYLVDAITNDKGCTTTYI